MILGHNNWNETVFQKDGDLAQMFQLTINTIQQLQESLGW